VTSLKQYLLPSYTHISIMQLSHPRFHERQHVLPAAACAPSTTRISRERQTNRWTLPSRNKLHTKPPILRRGLVFFRITTQLQYIEDSEPVVDGSHNRWCAVQWATETNYRCNKTKATKKWLLIVGVRLPTPIVRGVICMMRLIRFIA